jgi:hypothetical protein
MWLKAKTLILALSFSSVAQAVTIQGEIRRAAEKVGVPPELLSAICYAESNHRPNAFVYSDGTGTNHAFGACQVLLETAREMGFKDDRCENDFRYRKQERKWKYCKLFGYYTNAYYAAKYLKRQLKRYENSWIHATAAYNTGSVKWCKNGWVHNAHGKRMYRCRKGGILNQRYVDRVMHALESDK